MSYPECAYYVKIIVLLLIGSERGIAMEEEEQRSDLVNAHLPNDDPDFFRNKKQLNCWGEGFSAAKQLKRDISLYLCHKG